LFPFSLIFSLILLLLSSLFSGISELKEVETDELFEKYNSLIGL
jgi:hypothetical protein